MENLSRESSFLSQGTIEAVMSISGVTPLELDMYLKQEDLLPTSNSFEQNLQFGIEENFYPVLVPDSTQNQIPDVPLSTSDMPCTEEYPGPCGFGVDLCKSEGDKAKWEYSEELNKLYVVMGGKVPIKFTYDQKEFGLSVRALPIFLAQDYFAEPVRRCPLHMSSSDSSNKDYPHVEHIIRCHHSNATYDKNVVSERCSVLSPMDSPQPGTIWSTLVYSFMCKNSCPVGMNRRATAVIFTLERANGDVIGRKVINMRVCSCPRRDMHKDLADLSKKEKEEVTKNEKEEVTNELETDTKYMSDDGSQTTEKVKLKKPLKRLSNHQITFKITAPTESYAASFAKVCMEMVTRNRNSQELTPEENMCVQECALYLNQNGY